MKLGSDNLKVGGDLKKKGEGGISIISRVKLVIIGVLIKKKSAYLSS